MGELIKVDHNTAERERLSYAHCMVEVQSDKKFPDSVQFKNEKSILVQVPSTMNRGLPNVANATRWDMNLRIAKWGLSP